MTAPLKPPTSVRGHVSSYDYATLLDELIVDLPADLLWPTSVQTYATMRRESHLSSILKGWSLQLRRAQWQVDGTGCRPEVVQVVADDMGLPIAGRDEPTAARTRGVSWHEHLRTVLMSLVWGHFGFEAEADVSSGQARLVGLYERPPWTVGDIHVDPRSGAFRGITQDSPAASSKPPQIRADRMVWYAREREGANWAGTSLLRDSFPAWLVKREMLRVHATANRRFGMGVPVMEALPGTSPTSGQMAEAMQMASAARVGDQAGAASPPGFAFKLIGLSGGVPDTLAFLKFLNQEMSRAALMQHLDLGASETGSRALGTAFIDNWMLAVESEAESVTDTSTRQVAARVVGWNWGEDEPVPRVVCSGIGSKREVTAESLQLLLSSGALQADPGLEAWIRREYRLPEREGMARPGPSVPTVAASAGPSNTVTFKPSPLSPDALAQTVESNAGPAVLARRSRKAPPQDAGQLELPIAAAAADDLEAQSHADMDAIQAEWESARDDLAEQWPALAAPLIAALVASAAGAATVDGLADAGALVVDASIVAGLAEAIREAMGALAVLSARRAARELRAQGLDIAAGVPDGDRLAAIAHATAQVLADSYATSARRVLLLRVADGVPVAQVQRAVREHLTDLSEAAGRGWVVTNLAGALSAAQHAGRMATFEQVDGRVTFVASERGDAPNRCKPCADADGKQFKTLAEAIAMYPSGRNRACLGRERCRGQLLAVIPT